MLLEEHFSSIALHTGYNNVSSVEGGSVQQRAFSTSRGYHEYIMGISGVHWSDIMIHVGGISWVHWGVLSSLWDVMITSGEHHEYTGYPGWETYVKRCLDWDTYCFYGKWSSHLTETKKMTGNGTWKYQISLWLRVHCPFWVRSIRQQKKKINFRFARRLWLICWLLYRIL